MDKSKPTIPIYTRGGKRNGAGRKKLPPNLKTVRITITIHPAHLSFLKTIHPNISKAIRKLIESHKP